MVLKFQKYQVANWQDYLQVSDQDLLKSCQLTSLRGSGKGGQKRNKTSNAIRIKFFSFSAFSEKHRSQQANIKSALRKLKLELALDKKNKLTRKVWGNIPEQFNQLLSESIIRINSRNKDYAFFVGFFRDLVWQFSGDSKEIAKFLKVSRSQVHKWDKQNYNILEYYFKLFNQSS